MRLFIINYKIAERLAYFVKLLSILFVKLLTTSFKILEHNLRESVEDIF